MDKKFVSFANATNTRGMQKSKQKIFSGIFSLMALLSVGQKAMANEKPIYVVSDELFVRWRGVSEGARDRIYRNYGAERVWSSDMVSGLELIRLNSQKDLYATWQLLQKEPGVIYSEPNYVQHRSAIPAPKNEIQIQETFGPYAASNDPRLGEQWALVGANGMRVTQAWDKLGTLKEVKVGIIDTGIDSTHPDLAGRVTPGYDFIDETDVVRDVGGHGSHVAGIISATINNGIGVAGIAPNVSLIPIRAVPNEGDETDLQVIRSIEFAVLNGASIVNCSFGKDNASQAVAEAFLAAGEKGVLAVVAAGNSGANLDSTPMYPAAFHTPNMLVVGALNRSGARAYFSNFSPKLVDLFAPGAGILSTVPGGRYASYDGTSMASPAAAGVAALIRGMRPDMDPYQVRELMRESVRKIESLAGISISGGTVDAVQALEKASGL